VGLQHRLCLGVGGSVGLCFVPTVGAVQALYRKSPAVAGASAASGIGTLVLPPAAQLVIDLRNTALARPLESSAVSFEEYHAPEAEQAPRDYEKII
jgi:hypothetical protein